MAAAAHSNLYVRGWTSSSFGEADLIELFSAHGEITSLRMVGGEASQGTAGAPHAFVKFAQPEQAASAIQALNGTTVSGNQLVVKFADADVQPRVESGRQPSEWCYCRNLPATYTRQDVGEMFLPFGTVLEIRLFPSTELYKGSGALVQMQSMEQAAAAIHALNGSFPRGASQPLLVRYADSPAEKAAKQARKERLMAKQAANVGLFGNGNLLAAQLQQQLLGLAINGSGRPMQASSISSPDLSADLPAMLSLDGYQDANNSGGLPPAAMLQQQAVMAGAGGAATPGNGASIYIKGMPEDADKLWLYEKFARFGGICSVRVLIDEQSGKCNGIGFVNYVSADAARLAQESMNGVSMGDRLLHVMVQNPAARGRPQPQGSGANGLPHGATNGGAGAGGMPGARVNGAGGAATSLQLPAGSLGIHASTLASLQAASAAGLMPTATSAMNMAQLQPMANGGLPLGMGQGYAAPMGGQQGSFGSLQW